MKEIKNFKISANGKQWIPCKLQGNIILVKKLNVQGSNENLLIHTWELLQENPCKIKDTDFYFLFDFILNNSEEIIGAVKNGENHIREYYLKYS